MINGRLELYLGQLREMTFCEWKLREQSTVFGFLWTLLNPLITFVVLYALFTKWMGAKTGSYASYLLIGVIQYGFFSSASAYGLSSLRRRSGIVLNFTVSRELVPLAAVLSVAISHLFEFCLMIVFLLIMGARPSASWLALPALFLLLVTMMCGLGLLLSVLEARYQDFERIWTVIVTSGFYLTPIFYTLDVVSPQRRRLLWLNPMTWVIQMTRHAVLDNQFPPTRQLAALCALAFGLVVAGSLYFRREQSKLGDLVAV